MNHRHVLVFLLPLALLSPVAAAAEDDHAPGLVAAQGVGGGLVAIYWTQGAAPADAYRVYGAALDGSLEHLGTVGAGSNAFLVQDAYDRFAVAGVRDGVESPPVLSVIEPCVHVDMTVSPPSPSFAVPDCLRGILEPPGGVGIRIWLP